MRGQLKFSLCLDPVFTDYDYYDRVKIAAELGYDGIELWDVASLDPTRLRQVCDGCNMEIANFNCIDAWNQNMCRPSRTVLENMRESFKIGQELKARNILVLSSYREGRAGNYKNIMISNLKGRNPCKSGAPEHACRAQRLCPGFFGRRVRNNQMCQQSLDRTGL